MTGSMIASMPIEGEYGVWEGQHRPSTEWRFHLDIMRERPDVGAMIHTHATYATILSIARRPIPSCHYMIAVFGGTDIRCAEYATFGNKALAENAVKALKDRNGCLLANHGMIAAGGNLDRAMWLAVELETIAKQVPPHAADRRPCGAARVRDRGDAGLDAAAKGRLRADRSAADRDSEAPPPQVLICRVGTPGATGRQRTRPRAATGHTTSTLLPRMPVTSSTMFETTQQWLGMTL